MKFLASISDDFKKKKFFFHNHYIVNLTKKSTTKIKIYEIFGIHSGDFKKKIKILILLITTVL